MGQRVSVAECCEKDFQRFSVEQVERTHIANSQHTRLPRERWQQADLNGMPKLHDSFRRERQKERLIIVLDAKDEVGSVKRIFSDQASCKKVGGQIVT